MWIRPSTYVFLAIFIGAPKCGGGPGRDTCPRASSKSATVRRQATGWYAIDYINNIIHKKPNSL